MMVCDTFAFLHLHKSGGTFVNRMMVQCIASTQRIGYHLPYGELPQDYRALPILGTVRNPWSYYVSWYHFQHAQENPNPLFRLCSQDKALDFAATVTRLAGLQGDDRLIDQLIDVFPNHFVSYGLNLTKACLAPIRGSGLGFYTFLHDRLYAGAPSPRIIPMENLRENLAGVPLGLRPREASLVRQYLAMMPSLNVSQHGRYQDYYTPQLQALIATLDKPVIDAYGYRFDAS